MFNNFQKKITNNGSRSKLIMQNSVNYGHSVTNKQLTHMFNITPFKVVIT